MAIWSRIFSRGKADGHPRAATQLAGGGVVISTSQQLEEALAGGAMSNSGVPVTPETAMRVATVYACVRIISGAVATLPLHIKRRVDDRTREDASNHAVWNLLRRKPNRWQTPSQFRRMMQAHVLLRGNGYGMKVVSRGEVKEIIPLHPDRVTVKQLDDLSLVYTYTRKDGRQITLPQNEVFHLVGLSLDGVMGVSPITYARETIGLSLSMENHGATMFRNGARFSMVLKHPNKLGKEGLEFLQASLDAYRAGGDKEGKALILEEAMDVSNLSMTAEDAQWIESRKLSRSDVAMFFGVPPHMLGDTEKTTSWGSGIEQQSIGFVAYTLEDHLTMWEETIGRDLLLSPSDRDLYARFNRAALVRGDLKTRMTAYVQGLQWRIWNPNEVRALEDMNPYEGGDEFLPTPNTAGSAAPKEGSDDDKEAA